MALIRWHGTIYSAAPVKQLPNGDWLMTANEHGPRFTVGTTIQVKQDDIENMDAAEMPDQFGSLAALEKALAEERKTLPSVRELLLQDAKRRTAPGPTPS